MRTYEITTTCRLCSRRFPEQAGLASDGKVSRVIREVRHPEDCSALPHEEEGGEKGATKNRTLLAKDTWPGRRMHRRSERTQARKSKQRRRT